jgi:PUB domain
VKTLFTILSNLASKPLDPQVRRFNKSNKTIQAKILNFGSAVRFLEIVGFPGLIIIIYIDWL